MPCSRAAASPVATCGRDVEDHAEREIGVDVVADHGLIDRQRQAHVVQAGGGERELAGRPRLGQARRLAVGGESLAQVQAADVEPDLDAQHHEEAQDVFERLGQRVGDLVEAPVRELAEGPEPVVIAVGDREAVARPVEYALEQALLAGRRSM